MEAKHKDHWMEHNWPFLVILFGLLFVTLIVTFQPTW
jgi:hypothetical protein